MSISREEGLKQIRERLESELQKLSKMEKNKEIEKRLERIKSLLKLSEKELEKELEKEYKEINSTSKGLSDEELDKVAGGTDKYNNVPNDDWYEAIKEYLSITSGNTSGYDSDKFKPDDPLTKEEFLSIISDKFKHDNDNPFTKMS